MDFRSILEEALEAWSYTRAGVIEEARSLPEKDFGHRASEKSRSVIELLQHIIESGLLMSGELSRPEVAVRAGCLLYTSDAADD